MRPGVRTGLGGLLLRRGVGDGGGAVGEVVLGAGSARPRPVNPFMEIGTEVRQWRTLEGPLGRKLFSTLLSRLTRRPEVDERG